MSKRDLRKPTDEALILKLNRFIKRHEEHTRQLKILKIALKIFKR